MDKIYLASGNAEKVKEAHAILGVPIEIADIELDEVQSMNLEYVVRKKAEEAHRQIKKPVIVDDVGLYIDAWNGFPGPFIKFLLKSIGNNKFLEILKNEKNRGASVQGSIAYHDGKKVYTFVETVRAQISDELRGDDGWGFDFFIIPNGKNQTFAEMGAYKKNQISHRAGALAKLKLHLTIKKLENKI